MNDTIVIALGGNAIKSSKEIGTYETQYANVKKTTSFIAQLIEQGKNVVITHGNGPQVGDLLVQHDCAKAEIPPLPMFMCGSQTQGSIGFLIQQTLQNHLRERGVRKSVSTVVTQVLVSPNDVAFDHPSKPVGPFYASEEEIQVEKQKGYIFIEDAGRGFRRVVPSPQPLTIVEIDTIRKLIKNDIVTIASGGGGIPVYEEDGSLYGIDAVIDKDMAGQLLAREVDADTFIVLTDVEKVALNFNTPEQKDIDTTSVLECKTYIQEGHFAKGSMLPKIQASIKFLEDGGKKVIITHPFKVLEALNGKTGTIITP